MSITGYSLNEAQRLSAMILAKGQSQSEIAAAVGASQSQISRILAAKITRPTSVYRRLCVYAFSLSEVQGSEDAGKRLASEALKVWDGSSRHAALLTEVLQVLGQFGRTAEDGQ